MSNEDLNYDQNFKTANIVEFDLIDPKVGDMVRLKFDGKVFATYMCTQDDMSIFEGKLIFRQCVLINQ